MLDPIIEKLKSELDARSERGFAKYGVGLDRGDLSLTDWLQHAKEEALDFAAYCQAAIEKITRENKALPAEEEDYK